MKAHVFITDKNTFPIVRDNSFWGVGIKAIPNTFDKVIKENLNNGRKPYFGMIGDILGTRIGDAVFLYERQAGFHGIYKIVSKPFFDPTPIGCVGETWPIRVKIECLNYFPEPVPEDYLFSTKEYESKFWGWFYRKIQGPRGINTINPEATEALIELLVKINGNAMNKPSQISSYSSKNMVEIKLPLDRNGKVYLEDILRAWLITNIDDTNRKDLREIFGPAEDLEWFANNVPYHVTRKNIDILCYHKNIKYTGFPLRYKFSVVELKRDTAGDKDVSQVIEYSKWVAGRLAGSEIETVQPILIAFDFNERAKLKAKNSDFSDRGITFVKYEVKDGEIEFRMENF
ncbi:hypothetical protein CH333_02375 [candidate division WOR-3 bacterium JGI_Cruoil_03_44_89]|uniref:Uncharacterized protein n=1 Tax=candidate division WOR-3 bacterium JGI_Cruoil_03_44_89 TaxID=1973748 RepID=A0A235BXD7_UNCW3|nr:MAG: hypothetical protein CH333_02375 [candidate division WOR-3 bacterium JGI_Cruoil_03_44_89]